jgi:hypothetical protein
MSFEQELIDRAQEFRTIGLANPRDLVAISCVGAAITAEFFAFRDRRENSATTDLPGYEAGDDVLAEQSIVGTTTGKKAIIKNRWREFRTLGWGSAALGVSMMGPTLDREVPVPDAAAVIIVDDSTPMRLTQDMENEETRRLSTQNGLRLAFPLPEDLSVGVVNFGAEAEVALGLSLDRELLIEAIDEQNSDPTSSNLADALKSAQDIFEGYTVQDAPRAVVVMTDGGVDDPDGVREQLTLLASEGIDVSVIVTGTEDGSFKRTPYDEQSIDSSIETAPFSDINGVDVVTVNSSQQIGNELVDGFDDISTATETSPAGFSKYLRIGGAVAMGIGFFGGLRRTRERKV